MKKSIAHITKLEASVQTSLNRKLKEFLREFRNNNVVQSKKR